MTRIEGLNRKLSDQEIVKREVLGVSLETVPFEKIFIGEKLEYELRDELDIGTKSYPQGANRVE